MCCTQLAENTGRKNYAKNRHLRTIAHICWAIYILKCDASVRLCAPWSERALTLYTQQQTALLRPIYPVSAVVGS